jgi:hypothetical protein
VLLQARIKAGIERKRWHDREQLYRHQLERNERFIRATFGRYLSDDIVTEILERPEGLELGGDLREVTIMMSDIRGFTTLTEQLPAGPRSRDAQPLSRRHDGHHSRSTAARSMSSSATPSSPSSARRGGTMTTPIARRAAPSPCRGDGGRSTRQPREEAYRSSPWASPSTRAR